jgi:hypothetical protein
MVERYHKGLNWRADEESDRKAGRMLIACVFLCLIVAALCIATLVKRGEFNYGTKNKSSLQGSVVAQ